MLNFVSHMCEMFVFFYSRSPDGRCLAISSTDGFITFVSFTEGELGTLYHEQAVTISSRLELRAQENERQQEREKKKRAKDNEKKERQSNKVGLSQF